MLHQLRIISNSVRGKVLLWATTGFIKKHVLYTYCNENPIRVALIIIAPRAFSSCARLRPRSQRTCSEKQEQAGAELCQAQVQLGWIASPDDSEIYKLISVKC